MCIIIYICIYIHYICVYIYRQRERERERDTISKQTHYNLCTSEFRSQAYVTVSNKYVRWDRVGETSNQSIPDDKSRQYRQYRTGVERERESSRSFAKAVRATTRGSRPVRAEADGSSRARGLNQMWAWTRTVYEFTRHWQSTPK